MSYLARLKTLLHENPLPEQLTKPTQGASVSFVSEHGSPFCADEDADAIEERERLDAEADAIEERAAIVSCPKPAPTRSRA